MARFGCDVLLSIDLSDSPAETRFPPPKKAGTAGFFCACNRYRYQFFLRHFRKFQEVLTKRVAWFTGGAASVAPLVASNGFICYQLPRGQFQFLLSRLSPADSARAFVRTPPR